MIIREDNLQYSVTLPSGTQWLQTSLASESSIGPIAVKVVRTLDEFRSLREAWNQLAAENDSYLPWFSWEWFDLWFRFFLGKDELFILMLYRAGKLSAIAPFLLKREKYKGLISVRKLELAGNQHSPVRGFIFGSSTKESRQDLFATMLAYISHDLKTWDVIEMERVPEEYEKMFDLANIVSRFGLRYRVHFSIANWHLDGIDCSFEEYFQSLPKGLRKDIQYCLRRLQNSGVLEIRVVREAVGLGDYLDMYDMVRARSWKAPESGKEFVREFSMLAAEKGWLRLLLLLFDGKTIGAQKWIVGRGVAYIWSVVYDEEYKKYSPGSVLSSEACRYVIEADEAKEIDYLVGDEPYKKLWTPKRRERKGITLFNKNAKGKLLGAVILQLIPALRNAQRVVLWSRRLLEKLGQQNTMSGSVS